MRSKFAGVISIMLASGFVVAGCGTMGSQMSPEQMAQAVKDKNAVVGCVLGTGPWGKTQAVYVDTNRIADNNMVTVDSECKVQVTATKAAAPVR